MTGDYKEPVKIEVKPSSNEKDKDKNELVSTNWNPILI